MSCRSAAGSSRGWRSIALFNDGDEWVVSLLDGERFAGKPAGLPSVSFGAGRTTQLATADRIEVRLEQCPPTEVAYEIQARRGPKVFAPIRGRLRIKDTPAGLTPSFDRPIARTQIGQPIVIEAVVPETLMLAVSPSGLVWLPRTGAPPGMEDERGRYILVEWSTVVLRADEASAADEDGEAASRCRSSSACEIARSACSGHARRRWPAQRGPRLGRRPEEPAAGRQDRDDQESGRPADPNRPGDHL